MIWEERSTLRLDLEQLWAQMEEYGEDARAYVTVRRDEALSWASLEWSGYRRLMDTLEPGVAIVSLSLVAEHALIMVLRAEYAAPQLQVVALSAQDLAAYQNSYDREVLSRHRSAGQPSSDWLRLGEVLFRPILPYLQDADSVYLLPNGQLHLIPLHALTVDGAPLIRRWKVAYAPSLSVLEASLSRPRASGKPLILATGDRRLAADREMLLEARKLARYFNTTRIAPTEASSLTLKQRGPEASIIHLACHGRFDEREPLNAGVQLADRFLTARDWLGLSLHADLVTLASCEAGKSSVRPGDDVVGLMRSILSAGAASMVLPLWQVDSEVTRHWMLEFYRSGWNPDGSRKAEKAAAFRNATLAIRANFRDPYYWAPFVLVGNPY